MIIHKASRSILIDRTTYTPVTSALPFTELSDSDLNVHIIPDDYDLESLPAEYYLMQIYFCSQILSPEESADIMKRFQEWQFRNGNSFCPSCGSLAEHKSDHMECTACARQVYPRISPAIITLIYKQSDKGMQIFLARNSQFPRPFFSLVAGFVSPGESMEQTVEREVMEETGMKVKNIRYIESQAWPFPDSLMLGFYAEYDSGEIVFADNELCEGGWYYLDELPFIPAPISISRMLINRFANEHAPAPAIKEINPAEHCKKLVEVISEANQNVAEIIGLTKENAPTAPAFLTQERLQEFLETTPDVRCMAASYKNEIIGCAFWRPAPDKEHMYFVERLAVIDRYRQRGIAKELVRTIETEIRRENPKAVISVATIDENRQLARWYEKIGYNKTGTKSFPHLPFTVSFREKLV